MARFQGIPLSQAPAESEGFTPSAPSARRPRFAGVPLEPPAPKPRPLTVAPQISDEIPTYGAERTEFRDPAAAAAPPAPAPTDLGTAVAAYNETPWLERAGAQLQSGIEQLRQGWNAAGARRVGQDMTTLDRIEAGQPVAPIDDPVGFGDMTPAQRADTRQQFARQQAQNVQDIAASAARQRQLPRNPAADAVIDRANKGDWAGAWEAFKTSPGGVLQQLSLESLPNAAPSMVAGLAAAPLGGIPAFMAGLAAGSFPVEYGAAIIEMLTERGIDLNDTAAVERAFADPQFSREAGQRGFTRGATIAGFDALGGRLMMPLRSGQTLRNIGRGAVNVGAETATEAAGEAAAQVASGQEIKAGEILAEALGAGPQAVASTIGSTIGAASDRQRQAIPATAPGQPPVDMQVNPAPPPPTEAGVPAGALPAEGTILQPDPVPARQQPTPAGPAQNLQAILDDPRTIEEIAAAANVSRETFDSQPGQPQNIPPGTPLETILNDPRPVEQIEADAAAAIAQQQATPQAFDPTPPDPTITGEPPPAEPPAPPPAAGTRDEPISISGPDDVIANADLTAQPTQAQAAAGNYQKRHVKWNGLDISIETEAGQDRIGWDDEGNEIWRNPSPWPYGYIKRSKGADGDQIDLYLGPDAATAPTVFVIDQIDPRTTDFDEHKAMIGFPNAEAARLTYESGFSDGSGRARFGAITEMTIEQFKSWVRDEQAGNDAIAYRGPPRPKAVAKKRRRSKPGQIEDAITFVARLGGIRDEGGNLAASDMQRVFVPRYGRLVRATGQHPDYVREALVEAQYLPEDADMNAAIDLLIEQFRTGKKAYSARDIGQVLEIEKARDAELDRDREEYARDDIVGFAREVGAGQLSAEEIDAAMWYYFNVSSDTESAVVYALEWSSWKLLPEVVGESERDDAPPINDVPPFNDGVSFDDDGPPTQPEPQQQPDQDGAGTAPQVEQRPKPDAGETQGDAPRSEPTGSGDQGDGAEESGPRGEAEPDKYGTPDKPNRVNLARRFASEFNRGRRFPSIVQARRFAAELMGGPVRPGTMTAKIVDEAIEGGVVISARAIVSTEVFGSSEQERFGALVNLYDRQPKVGVRTSDSVELQAYSTPVPLAYLASRLAGITDSKSVLEPTAGNGALLIETNKATAIVNELDPERAGFLRAQGFRPTTDDASKRSLYEPIRHKVDVVIANPPFGVVRDRDGATRQFQINERYQTGEIDHAISLRALDAMKDDGSAVLIIGSIAKTATTDEARSNAYAAIAKRRFYLTLYENYNVVDHFTVAGSLYEKQGAGWPVDVIVIRGRGKSNRKIPSAQLPQVFSTWDSLREVFNAKYRTEPDRTEPDVPDQPDSGVDAQGGRPGGSRPTGAGNSSGQRPSRPSGRVPGAGGKRPNPDVRNQRDPDGNDARPPGDVQRPPDQPRVPDAGGTERDPVAPPTDDEFEAQIKKAIEDELNKLFGDDEDTEQQPPPAPQQGNQRPPRDDDEDGAGPPPPAPTPPSPPRTPGQAASSAASNAAQSADDAMSALYQLFGGGKTVGSGPAFDDDTYAKAKPLFISAAQKFVQATKDAAELVRLIVADMKARFNMTREIIAGMTPYLVRFMADLREGRISVDSPAAPPEQPTPPAQPEPPKASAPKQEQETEYQVAYTPKSAVEGMGTLVPVNMRTATADSLNALADKYGDIDQFVADELGFEKGELGNYFGAEQVDAIALALDNFKKNAGFIIGDQTGIGKGRVNAAMIRWAIRNKKIPIFVTQKPNLYADMYRDMLAVGLPEMLGRDVRMLMTNNGQSIQLDKEGKKFLKSPTAAKHKQELADITKNPDLFRKKYDVLLTNYSQMAPLKGALTSREALLRTLASAGAVIMFDESHMAGGQGPQTRNNTTRNENGEEVEQEDVSTAATARRVAALADAVFYSSATYAKRPEVMDLYFKTDMRLAVDNIRMLGSLISTGGVPMQQAVAGMLAKAGQYVRRERSFAGVRYDSPITPVSRSLYAQASEILGAIHEFERKYIKAALKELKDRIKDEGDAVGFDGAVGEAGVNSVSFASIMHNIIAQVLLALKVDSATSVAMEALRNGEKPVITLSNTMGSIIQDFAESRGIANGGRISVGFQDVFSNYLDRTREVTIKKPWSSEPVTKFTITDRMLGPEGVAAFKRVVQMILDSDLNDLPISPIDAIRDNLARAGYSSGEITGRKHAIGTTDEGTQIYRVRPESEVGANGRRASIRGFQDGKIDVLVLNQAGSTGLSLHASPSEGKDLRPRHMILAQADANIDVHVQMLGRIHRSGQVVLPRYTQLVADVPAEKRPAAVLSKKMKSLSANTTANTDSAIQSKDTPDFMNQYGSEVVQQLLIDDNDLNRRLGEPLKGEGGESADPEELIRKVTGRIPLLPIEEQENVYAIIEENYTLLIEQLKAAGENTLEAASLDLKAKLIESYKLTEEKDSDSPFAAGATLDRMSVLRTSKPMTIGEVVEQIAENIGFDKEKLSNTKEAADSDIEKLQQASFRRARLQKEKVLEEAVAFEEQVIADMSADISTAKRLEMRKKLTAYREQWAMIYDATRPGTTVRVTGMTGSFHGIVIRQGSRESKASGFNPVAQSKWTITVATVDGARTITIPFSQMGVDGMENAEGVVERRFKVSGETRFDMFTIPQSFVNVRTDVREERLIVNGNILAGYAAVKGRGHIVNYTREDGSIVQGVLLSKTASLEEFIESRPIEFATAEQARQFLDLKQTPPIVSSDGLIRIVKERGNDRYVISVQSAKATGGKYFLDEQLREITGAFVKVVSVMRNFVTSRNINQAISRMMALGAKFTTNSLREEAQNIVGNASETNTDAPRFSARSTARTSSVETPFTEAFKARRDAVQESLRAELDRVGLTGVTLNLPDQIIGRTEKGSFEADGVFWRKAIWIALDSTQNLTEILHHEIIHALRGFGLFNGAEWSTLERMARAQWMGQYKIKERYGHLSEAGQIEEAIAHAYADWFAKRATMGGMALRAMNKIANFFKALGNALRGQGFRTAQDVFSNVESGVIGSRSQRAESQLAGTRDAMAQRRTDKTDQGEQTVLPGAERISDKELAERRMAGRKKSGKAQKGTEGLPLFDDDDKQGAMFALRRPPEGPEEAGKAMLAFIAKGQPIDRVFRLPFDFFGGIDAKGQYQPGARLYDKAAQIITEAEFDNTGRFTWLNGIMETARRGLIDRYGLDEQYVTRDRRRRLDENRVLLQAQEILTTIREQGIDVEEAKVLQAVLTGENVTDTQMAKVAAPIRAAIDQLGQEAVAVGLISPESFERNRGSYLHRVYQKHEADGLIGFVGRIMAKSRKKIIGDASRGRGIFVDVNVDRLMRDIAAFREAGRGTPLKGERFIILDKFENTRDMDLGDEPRKKRIVDRVYLPDDQPVPSQYWQYENMGTWEVRSTAPGKVTLWRDYTKAERKQMGEIIDARYTIARTFMLLAHDLSTGRFYKDISQNESWARSMPPPEGQIAIDAEEWRRRRHRIATWRGQDVQWVLVPQTEIPNSGGKKRWGALAGMWVREEIWRDINELDELNRPSLWRSLYRHWKQNKTSRSPVVHMNNVMSNLLFMDMADVRVQDLVRGIRAMVTKTADYREAMDNGAFGTDMISVEIRDNVLKPILDDIMRQQQGNMGSMQARFGLLGKITDGVWSGLKKLDNAMLDAYQIEDEIFRMATYMRRRQLGDTPADAADFARQQFIDYDIRAPWINTLRNTVLPFIGYTYRAAPVVARSIAAHPWKFAKYAALGYAAGAAVYAFLGMDDDDEERERAALRGREKGKTWIQTPKMIRMPWNDEFGNPVFLDSTRWIPAGDIFSINENPDALPLLAWMQPGGPLMIAAELLLNKSAFTGQPIRNTKADDWWMQTEDFADHVWKSWLPSAAWVPNSWYWERLQKAEVIPYMELDRLGEGKAPLEWRKGTDSQGRPFSAVEAALQSVGVKIKAINVEEQASWEIRGMRREIDEIRSEIRRAAREQDRGLISEAERKRIEAERIKQIERVSDKLEQIQERIRKKPGAGEARKP